MAMDPIKNATRALVSGLLEEACALPNSSPYIHLGGDEVKTGCWNASKDIQTYVSKKFGDLSDLSFRMLQVFFFTILLPPTQPSWVARLNGPKM